MEKRKGKRGRVGGGRETGEADEEAEREKGEATSDVRRRETSEGEKANARKSPRPPLLALPSAIFHPPQRSPKPWTQAVRTRPPCPSQPRPMPLHPWLASQACSPAFPPTGPCVGQVAALVF